MDGQPDTHLLARLDERTKAIQDSLNTIRDDFKTQSDLTLKKIDEIEDKLESRIKDVKIEMSDKFDAHEKAFVTHEQFKPVQRIIYSMIGLILTGFGTVLIAQVFRHGPS